MDAISELSNTEEIFELMEIILKEQYSKDISDIGRDLLFNGASTIPEIESRLKLSFESIKNALIVLLQNKLAVSVEITRKETLIIGYELIPDNVLAILQYPKILDLVNQKFGEFAVMIFEEIMSCGILTAKQVFEQVELKMEVKKKAKTAINKMKLMFISLIENNYIVQAAKVKGNERHLKENVEKNKRNSKGGTGKNPKEKKNENSNSNNNNNKNKDNTSKRLQILEEEIQKELKVISSSAKKNKKGKKTVTSTNQNDNNNENPDSIHDKNILIVSYCL